MWHDFFREAPLRVRVLLLAVILLVCWMLSSLIGIIALASAGYDITVLEKISPGKTTNYIEVLQILQIVQSVCLFVIPPLIYAWLTSSDCRHSLFLDEKPHAPGILLATAVLLFSIPFMNCTGKLNSLIRLPDFMEGISIWLREKEDFANEVSSAFLNRPASKIPLNLFIIAVIPALGEELLFRAVVQQMLIKLLRNMHSGIWLTSFLFGALHLQFFTFLPRIILGSLFGYLLEYSHSLWYPIIVHFLNNTLAVLFTYFGHLPDKFQNFEKLGSGKSEFAAVFLSIILTLTALWIFRKSFLQKHRYRADT